MDKWNNKLDECSTKLKNLEEILLGDEVDNNIQLEKVEKYEEMLFQYVVEDKINIGYEGDSSKLDSGTNKKESQNEAESSVSKINDLESLTEIKRKKKRAVQWTEEEHRKFLEGLNKFGRGRWKKISSHCLQNKTPSQIASHAQNFFRRPKSTTPLEVRRFSINDIRSPNASPPYGDSYQPILPNYSLSLIPPNFDYSFPQTASPSIGPFIQPETGAFPASIPYPSTAPDSS